MSSEIKSKSAFRRMVCLHLRPDIVCVAVTQRLIKERPDWSERAQKA